MIPQVLIDKWSYRLTAVQLVDAHLCTDPSKYIRLVKTQKRHVPQQISIIN